MKAAAPEKTVGLGLFFKEQDERRKRNAMSRSSDGTNTVSVHSAFCPVLVTISQKRTVEKRLDKYNWMFRSNLLFFSNS